MDDSKNSNISCPFGPALVEVRKLHNISQSGLSILAKFNVTNLRKIEKGVMQPGVSIAVRLVAATGADVGNFFQGFAEDNGLIPSSGVPGSGNAAESVSALIKGLQLPTEKRHEIKSIFGLLFKKVRLYYGVTQKVVAGSAQYNLRNLLNVENGQQEPGIMTALAMVCATGVDVKAFFGKLHQFLCECSPE